MIDAIFMVIENENQRNELAEFYSEHKNRLYSIAFSKLHSKEDAEDAVQEVFSEIADKPDKFFEIPPENRLAYTDVILRNIAIDMFKKKNKVQIVELDEDVEDVRISLDNALFEEVGRDEIAEFVNSLPTKRRSVLILRCFFDLSIDEISQRLNIAPATVSKHLTLARKAVKEFVEERNKRYE